MIEVFLDASYAVALSSVKDQYHQRAMILSEKLETESPPLWWTPLRVYLCYSQEVY
jgi:hypothetical protein